MTVAVALKICGVTRAADLRACVELGVDAVGFNLWPGSSRYLDLRSAERLLGELPCGPEGHPNTPLRVGVFVDQEIEHIAEAIAVLDLDLVQPHGDGDPSDVAALAERYDIGWIWVIRGTPALEQLSLPEPRPAWILLDAAVAGFGGAGQQTDWAWAAAAVEAFAPTPVWLAGGITTSNVEAALRQVRPAGIDVASGAERISATDRGTPGEKQPAAIAALVRACRGL